MRHFLDICIISMILRRLRTMSDEKLQRRIRMIKRIDKMEDFIQARL